MSRWLGPGVALIAVTWVLLILAAPVLWLPAAAVIYAAGSFICHQIPERSFHIESSQLPVCARCFGIYGGVAVGSVIGASAVARRWVFGARPLLARSLRWTWTAIAALPTIATFALEWGFGWPISNSMRAIAALPLGAAVAFVVVSALTTLDS